MSKSSLVKPKISWVSRQIKPDAWRLSIAVGERKFSVKGLLFGSPKLVEKAMKAKIVFVPLKSTVKKVRKTKPAKKPQA